MTARPPFVTRADIEARHPQTLAVLAADEETRVVDPARVEAACADASTEIRGILGARYDADALARLTAESRGLLLLYALDIALYRISSSFGRTTEELAKRYDAAVKRLEAIAAGKGALECEPAGGVGGPPAPGPDEPGTIPPAGIVMDAPERLFTRRRYGGGARGAS